MIQEEPALETMPPEEKKV